MPFVDIIIVNWNAGNQLRRCLQSIATYGGQLVSKVVVVDNASTDGSLDAITSLELPFEIIRNRDNQGFARACNQGAALCDAPYLLFLNPDTELYEDSLSVPLGFMEEERNSKVGICGIQLVGGDGKVARTCARFPSFKRLIVESIGLNRLLFFAGAGMHMKEWAHDTSRQVDQVIGAFFLVRRNLFLALSGFDELFFVYFEEVDFSFRAKLLGWESWYLIEVKAFHEGGGTSRQVKAHRLFYSIRSRLLYGFKHFSVLQAWGVVLSTFMLEPFTRTGYCLLQGDLQGIANTIKAYSLLFNALPYIAKYNKG
jgi:GT2 family glycosyltransferase